MQLRMAARRSLNGSMTVVGDIAQATGPLAPSSWDDVVRYLPTSADARDRRAERRLPHPRPDHGPRQPGDDGGDAGAACPDGGARGDDPPWIVGRRDRRLWPAVARHGAARCEADRATATSPSSTPTRWTKAIAGGAQRRRHRTRPGDPHRPGGRRHGRAGQRGEGSRARRRRRRRAGRGSSAEERRACGRCTCALTRSTRRLTVVHAEPLPAAMTGGIAQHNGSAASAAG